MQCFVSCCPLHTPRQLRAATNEAACVCWQWTLRALTTGILLENILHHPLAGISCNVGTLSPHIPLFVTCLSSVKWFWVFLLKRNFSEVSATLFVVWKILLHAMHQPVGIQTLSNELLQEILNHIDVDPDRAIPVDRRAYLSVESFRLPSPPIPPRAQDIASFRLVCRRFADLGAPHQFTRIATRFSKAGLQRLEKIASQPHLARHTKKFSYLIPCFYVEGKLPAGRATESCLHSSRKKSSARFGNRSSGRSAAGSLPL
jgi:hypothetical protein